MKIFVGNLNYETTADDLRTMFEPHGRVSDTHVASDRTTGQPRGFGFVTMDDNQEATAAIAALNGQEVGGRTLTVNQARPKPASGGGFGGGRRGRF